MRDIYGRYESRKPVRDNNNNAINHSRTRDERSYYCASLSELSVEYARAKLSHSSEVDDDPLDHELASWNATDAVL